MRVEVRRQASDDLVSARILVKPHLDPLDDLAAQPFALGGARKKLNLWNAKGVGRPPRIQVLEAGRSHQQGDSPANYVFCDPLLRRPILLEDDQGGRACLEGSLIVVCGSNGSRPESERGLRSLLHAHGHQCHHAETYKENS